MSRDTQSGHLGVLLVNPPSAPFYEGVPIRQGVPYSPVLSLATVAAGTLQRGHRVQLVDCNLSPRPMDAVRRAVARQEPDWVGVTLVTPLWDQVRQVVQAVRQVNRKVKVVVGGPHASALPAETLRDLRADAVVFGEGDFALAELIDANDPGEVPGVAVRSRTGDEIRVGERRPLLRDLDQLPLPAWELFDVPSYRTTRLLCRRSPAGWIETSRGCPFGCIYCSKDVFGRNFRTKSPVRVVDEMERMLRVGFREIHIADDCFTANPRRVRAICEEILRRDLRFPWAPVTGIRVDGLDEELLRLMRRAGCYRVYFGVESGSDEILTRVNKGIAVEQVRLMVRASKRAGLETFGFFMIALPGETVESMTQTRRLARELDLDMAKISVTMPLPGTALFDEIERDGRLLARRWADYNLYRPARTVYRHETLDWDTVEQHYRRFYRSFFLRPRFALRRLAYALRHGTLMADLAALVRTKW